MAGAQIPGALDNRELRVIAREGKAASPATKTSRSGSPGNEACCSARASTIRPPFMDASSALDRTVADTSSLRLAGIGSSSDCASRSCATYILCDNSAARLSGQLGGPVGRHAQRQLGEPGTLLKRNRLVRPDTHGVVRYGIDSCTINHSPRTVLASAAVLMQRECAMTFSTGPCRRISMVRRSQRRPMRDAVPSDWWTKVTIPIPPV